MLWCFVLRGCLTPCLYLYLWLGDHRPLPRAWQQWVQAGLSRSCQGEGEGRDDHLLPHQWPCGQVVWGGVTTTGLAKTAEIPSGQHQAEQWVTAQNGSRWWPALTHTACLRVATCTHIEFVHPSTSTPTPHHAAGTITKPSCLRLEVEDALVYKQYENFTWSHYLFSCR